MQERLKAWREEQQHLSENYASAVRRLCRKGMRTSLRLLLKSRVCREWKEIAMVTRSKVFRETEQGEIDLFDVKCKEWGFLLKDLFRSSLGTEDYGHLTIDHAPMLMRRLLSMTEFSHQGFEASHKDQRQLWVKESSHDQLGRLPLLSRCWCIFTLKNVCPFDTVSEML
ncbi:uncharacterized protein [Montipora capricornis]|uniref:uncharacterized protein n=1 Tax=Montipora capricornis TaxID=246305 RepID=UPI0035F20E36